MKLVSLLFLFFINGSVYTDDGKFISNLDELPLADIRNTNDVPPGIITGEVSTTKQLAKHLKDMSDGILPKMEPKIHELVFQLNSKSLEYLENRREKNNMVTLLRIIGEF